MPRLPIHQSPLDTEAQAVQLACCSSHITPQKPRPVLTGMVIAIAAEIVCAIAIALWMHFSTP